MNALEIRSLTTRRGDFALQGLDLTLPAGCIMGLIGENGAGKSTTIRLILNGLRRDGGTKPSAEAAAAGRGHQRP